MRYRMCGLAGMVLALALSTAGSAQEVPPAERPSLLGVFKALEALGLAVEQACIASGFEYRREDRHQLQPGGQWRCTGIPRREQ